MDFVGVVLKIASGSIIAIAVRVGSSSGFFEEDERREGGKSNPELQLDDPISEQSPAFRVLEKEVLLERVSFGYLAMSQCRNDKDHNHIQSC